MSDKTGIEWTDHTFNPWWGCVRVSPACRFCYADRDAQRYGHQLWRRHGERRMLSDANWARPLKWDRNAKAAGVPAKVFCASMADVFEDHLAVAEPRERLWGLIESTPHLIWQLLTKRPENVDRMAPWGHQWPGNVWLGTSAENQHFADERLPLLAMSGARTLFVSAEPLLGPVDLTSWPEIGWVIAGGESGPKARPSHPGWFRDLRDQCRDSFTPFLFKQWGEWGPRSGVNWPLGDAWKNPQRHCWVNPVDGKAKPFGAFLGTDDLAWARMFRVGKRAAGRELDGRTWDEFPAIELEEEARND